LNAILRQNYKNVAMNIFQKLFSSEPPTDYATLVKTGAMIIDVRSPGEFSSGHIDGSINIPLDEIAKKAPELEKKNKVLITVCRSGNRSGSAKAILEKAGLEVYNGGAWDTLQKKIS
jgi:rhodanese-related sulfurtransferase